MSGDSRSRHSPVWWATVILATMTVKMNSTTSADVTPKRFAAISDCGDGIVASVDCSTGILFQVKRRSDPQYSAIKYSVGMVMLHKRCVNTAELAFLYIWIKIHNSR